MDNALEMNCALCWRACRMSRISRRLDLCSVYLSKSAMARRRSSTDSKIPLAPNGLPASSDWLFPEYDFEKMRLTRHAFTIMERILENGRWDELNWLFDHYGDSRIRRWVREYGFMALTRRSFALWRLVLDIKRYRKPWWAKRDKLGPW